MKKLIVMMGAVVALAMGVMAETVTVTKFNQSYPYSGKATVEYTVGGTLPANSVAEITLNTDDASATFVQSNIVAGANTFTIDFASSFGGALLLTNTSFVVTIAELGGVQLWANGPYWAECNVGASRPEEYGYYFWWGDTVGYKRENDAWVATDGSASNFQFYNFPISQQTYNKSPVALQSEGWIVSKDGTNVLTPEHDAAQVHWGGGWRMPTNQELGNLCNNCDWTWTTMNGVNGYVVRGRGDYASASIFLPAAGFGGGPSLYGSGSGGRYWSSVPCSGNYYSWYLLFGSDDHYTNFYDRSYGQSVRSVRGFAGAVAVGIVTYDLVPVPAAPVISPESGTTFASSLTVTISCETEGAAIYYTTDGSEPKNDSTTYRRFKIYGKTTVKAVAYDAATGLYSGVATAEYALGTCANPVIAPAGGSATATEGGYVFYRDGQTVTITRNGEEGTIRYTLDGTDPTAESASYSGAITIGDTTTVKAKVFSGSYFDSETVTVVFVREWEQVATPEIAAATTFTGSKTKCEITCATEGANIYYTLNGNDPTSHSTRYVGAFYVTESCTLKAIAMLSGCRNSEMAVKTITKERTIGDTMGAPDHAFATSGDGDKAFYRVADASAPNGEAMHSGDIGNSGAYGSFARTVLSTTVTGPGTVSFSWKASCEDDAPDYEWDHGEFAVDGVVEAYVSGETGWTNVSVAVTGSGEHTLTWTYLKDDAEYEGEDCIWVAGYGWASAEAYTHTTVVPVPHAWLRAHDLGVVDEYEAYEASAQATAANGWKVWECYALGLDPQVATSDFRIASFPMKADGTPDFANVAFDPPQERWNVPDAPVTWKGAAQLEGPWRTVREEVGRGVPPSRDGSPGTARPTIQFFKAVVFGDAEDDPDDAGDGVQLWENGPYWAECNVGASNPEEYGYYFWWGDTVGYARSGGTWDGYYSYSGVTWVSSTGGQMSSSPFSHSSCPTCGRNTSELLSAGYIDASGNLVAAHDAATAHLGSPWRMPTDAEISALVNNCTTTWISTNGVFGRLVTGKGAYANRSIFLPAAGYGDDSYLNSPGSDGDYWSSTPDLHDSGDAWRLFFSSSSCYPVYSYGIKISRCGGRSVRPVRGFAP